MFDSQPPINDIMKNSQVMFERSNPNHQLSISVKKKVLSYLEIRSQTTNLVYKKNSLFVPGGFIQSCLAVQSPTTN